LHVTDDYRATYQFLGSWVAAAGEGQNPKELHVVYASPGTIAAYRKSEGFPDGAVLVKEVNQTATDPMTTGIVSRRLAARETLASARQSAAEEDRSVAALASRLD
jgi:hypothetical protein